MAGVPKYSHAGTNRAVAMPMQGTDRAAAQQPVTHRRRSHWMRFGRPSACSADGPPVNRRGAVPESTSPAEIEAPPRRTDRARPAPIDCLIAAWPRPSSIPSPRRSWSSTPTADEIHDVNRGASRAVRACRPTSWSAGRLDEFLGPAAVARLSRASRAPSPAERDGRDRAVRAAARRRSLDLGRVRRPAGRAARRCARGRRHRPRHR